MDKAIAMAGGGGAPPSGAGGPATIPLGRLIDFVLQKTYHELTVLAELLPRKSDMERKIEITTFTNTTRQLFVRLLALVKWAASAGKVEKCASMVNFLDKQSLLFIEAADMFALLARDTLVQARLPSFHIPCAAEILTTGTYSRLPTCIRDKIVPPDPISTEDKRSTLERLNRIIQYRLVSSELPTQMSSLDIKRGRVIFRVDNEFEVSLTLMGDGPQVPWRLLSINILVEDKDTGDCRALVHPLQVNYIHQLVQSRLVDHSKPLHELFECLHFFCLSLQLEVLHSQILRLCRERLGDSVRIEEYVPGSSLRLHFWREHISLLDHRPFVLMVHVDAEQPCKPLQVSHSPEITEKAEQVWVEPCIRSEFLSIEKLLIQTIHIRSRQKLAYLKDTYLKELLPADVECTLSGSPPLLQLPVVHPCPSSEHLVLTVDTHTGYIMAFVPQYEPPMVTELQDTINNLVKEAQPALRARLTSAILSLKFWMTLKRCKKTVQHLPVLAMDTNPFVQAPEEHRINLLGKYSLFVKLCKHAHYYVIIDLQAEKPSDSIEFHYYLMSVTSDNRLSSFYELDAHSIVHGPCTDVDIMTSSTSVIGLSSSIHNSSSNALKRPLNSQEKTVLMKKPRYSGYFFSDVAHIVAFCDDRLPFCSLTRELESRGICHRGLQIEGAQTNFCVNIVQMPPTKENGLSEEVAEELRHSLLSCTFRLQVKGIKAWLCELVFHDCPLTTSNVRERGATRPVYFMYDFSQNNMAAVVDEWLADWAVVCKLYGVVARYASDMKKPKHAALLEMSEVRSYTYTRLTLAYGPEKNDTVTISWRAVERRFQLVFGVVGPSASATNPHATIAHQLSYDFNQHESVIQLLQALRDTYRPLLSLSRLPSTPQLGVINSRPTVPVQTFVIIPQSSTCFKLIYRGNYCLEVQCRKGDGCVIIRDGAFSHFDKGRHVEEFVPIPGLRAFLGKFTGGCEAPHDPDNPVSPLALESVDAFLSPSQAKGAASSPASNRSATTDNALRFPQHHPMTPPSNPHTPASPHPSMLHSNYTASPNPSFVHTPSNIPPSSPLAPPPSSPYPVNSPHMTSPSPSPAQQPPSQQSFATATAANDPTSPAFPLLSASPANTWPSSPAPPRPSPRPFQPSPGGPSPAQPPSVEVRQPPVMSRMAPPHPGNWAAAMPIVLTHEKLDQLCTPTAPGLSPIERFLGCAFMRNFIQRHVETAQGRAPIGLIPDSGIVTFRLEPLVYRVSLNPATMQSLHVKISPVDPNKEQLFTVDEIQVVERYFDAKVASIPYKPNAFISFYRLMGCTQRILRDFIQLMRLELCPPQTPMFRWNFQLCLTIPPAVPQIVPPGMTSMVIQSNKMLFFMQLSPTRSQSDPPSGQISLPGQPTIVVPLVYDFQMNSISIANRRSNGELSGQTLQAMNIIAQILRQGPEYQNNGECTIFASIRDVLTQLIVS
ncbi:mediator of RNA polymerase II transcription subunit 14-like [Varroa jacobsoni]|uniref:Mediator of RNA polymerase II transcription subunit 14 n=1 Tax=Varroa destructor TaxID=109461 RepID=A0A7M7JME3_VARDE|nr:mediator of RNA polymerase II transcription subunit 14-like [Varroa destructor]XP_022706183.1 mediator of RNA polymerase II transcription subunit 14-like [Varroa jacobsoni]